MSETYEPALKYRADYHPERAYKLALLGLTNDQLAEALEIDRSTVYQWQIDYPEFKNALREGKVIADAEVAGAMYQAALGFEHDAIHFSNYEGVVSSTPYTKKYPPDIKAAVMWLKNRQPDTWREKTEVTHVVDEDMVTRMEAARRRVVDQYGDSESDAGSTVN